MGKNQHAVFILSTGKYRSEQEEDPDQRTRRLISVFTICHASCNLRQSIRGEMDSVQIRTRKELRCPRS